LAWRLDLRGRRANAAREQFRSSTKGWKSEIKLAECQDNPTLIAALARLWASKPAGEQYNHPTSSASI